MLVQPEAAPSHSWTSALTLTRTGGGKHRLELGHARISPADANGAAAGALTSEYLSRLARSALEVTEEWVI